MNLLDKLIEDFVMEVIGRDVLELVNYLKKNRNVSEFKLAEKLDLTVNQTRNMLYRLYSYSLVDFSRKKDKKKGWYIYYWDLNLKRVLEAALAHKENRLEVLKGLLKKEEAGQYFSCPDGDVRLGFEQAIEHGFKCPECDKVLVQDNNARKIQRLTKTIAEIEVEIREGKEIKVEVREEPKREVKKRKRKAKRKQVKRKKAKKKARKKAKSGKKVISRKERVKKKQVRKKYVKRKAVRKKKPVKRRVSRRKR